MPELPEVETLKRALIPIIREKKLLDIQFFRKDLRFPIPRKILRQNLLDRPIEDITRRGKYLLFHSSSGKMIWHLGMSGHVIQYPSMRPVEKHTHAVFKFEPDTCLHFIDPRRFGCILWVPDGQGHPLLNNLGLEPFATDTTASLLKEKARQCKVPIKSFLMDARRLVGVGNIYACESLFTARIHPKRKAGRVSLKDWERLLSAIRETLHKSILSGGTTLRDFFSPDGSTGYFQIKLSVYGKESQPCPTCAKPISRIIQSGHSTFYCRACQKR